MLISQPLQISDTGKWRVVETSDENPNYQVKQCPCADGHESADEAMKCFRMRQIPMISDEQRAKRYRRKLEDLLQATSNLLLNLSLLELSAKQKPLAMALADEAYLIRQQLDIEKDFRAKYCKCGEYLSNGGNRAFCDE